MNGHDEAPVTRRELKAELAEFKAEFKAEMSLEIAAAVNHVSETLGAHIDRLRDEVRADMVAMRNDMASMRSELSRELAGHVRAAAEENRQFLAAFDDRYRDLPPRVALLERELDQHRRDTTLHPPRRRKR